MIERCPACKRKLKRSNNANARLWLLYHAIAEKLKPDGNTFGAEVWHTWAKSKFLGCDEVRMPNGKTMLILRSTADLDSAEFTEYMTKLEIWANEHDVWLDSLESA